MEDVKVWKSGEYLAKQFLIKQKYKILHTNFKTNIGEIDIVAKDKKTIVFVEVKAKSTLSFGYPREMVTQSKQQKILMVAQQYQKRYDLFDAPCRFDVIEILDEKITHIKNAF